MTEYSVEFKSSAEKDLRRIDTIHLESIFSRIGNLSVDPISHESKKLSGSENLYRIRSGDYRIIYSVNHNENTVTIYYVRHRKVAYRNF
ncbi:type II toxin-antitoxin system RelE family toxin [Methanogenium cariaci]|jgi:mRNA interferase RelE/StbE